MVVQVPPAATLTDLETIPLLPLILSETLPPGSPVPETGKEATSVEDKEAPEIGEVMEKPEAAVSMNNSTTFEVATFPASSEPVAVKVRSPSAREETFTTTLHVPTGLTDTVVLFTFAPEASRIVTKTRVPGSAKPDSETVGALTPEIMN